MSNEQSNLHIPQRLEGESFTDYKIRRLQSKEANAAITTGSRTTRQLIRDELRSKGRMKHFAGAYGKGLRNWITQENQRKLKSKD